jgi:hypothetical protein
MGQNEIWKQSHHRLPAIAAPPFVVERDDGFWSIGWHDDAPGPFETLPFALAVAADRARRAIKSTVQ